jgi:uncharacterized protein DUF1348
VALHVTAAERVSLVRRPVGHTDARQDHPDGEEILVLECEFADEHGRYGHLAATAGRERVRSLHPRRLPDVDQARAALIAKVPRERLVNAQYKWSIMFASTEEGPTIESRPQLPPFAANAAHQRVRAATGTWNTRDTALGALTYTPGRTCRNSAQFISGRLGF